jgi:rare lipoprotein A
MGAAPRRLPLRAALALLVLVLLAAGCASRRGADGPPDDPPADLASRPDAQPRVEPLRVGGPNKPYTVAGRRYTPMTDDLPLQEQGLASWYGRAFHGRPTASGEPYDMYAMTAAHKTMPLPSYARVFNPANGRSVVVRVNDRGPFAPGRVIDLSYAAAVKLGVQRGVAPVQVQRLTHAQIRAGIGSSGLAPEDPPPAADGGDRVAAGDADPAAGWWLQLGAFRQRDSALALQRRAATEWPGQNAALFDDSALVRVRLGPFGSRDEALAMAQQVREQWGLQPQLVEPQ